MKNKFRSTGFYMELILNVLFFAALAAVSLSALSSAYKKAEESGREAAQSTLCFSALQEAKEQCAAGTFPGEILFHADASFTFCEEEDAPYRLVVTGKKGEDGLWRLTAVLSEGGQPLYSAEGAQYVKGGAENGN